MRRPEVHPPLLKRNFTMKKLLAVAALLAATSAAAFAATQDTPGTPGDKNCAGQSMAYLAQGNETGARGIGNVASVTGLSVKEIKALVEAYCAQ